MSSGTRKALREVQANVQKRTPLIEKKLAQVGAGSNHALVFSTAQYYDTLKKLAKS